MLFLYFASAFSKHIKGLFLTDTDKAQSGGTEIEPARDFDQPVDDCASVCLPKALDVSSPGLYGNIMTA